MKIKSFNLTALILKACYSDYVKDKFDAIFFPRENSAQVVVFLFRF